MAMLATTALAAAARAQSSYPCANDPTLSPGAELGTNARPWGPANAISVDSKNNLWVVDPCEDKAVSLQRGAVFELLPDGRR